MNDSREAPDCVPAAEVHRAAGKKAFAVRDFEAARQAFTRALDCLRHQDDGQGAAPYPSHAQQLAATLLCNRSLCASKAGDWQASRQDALDCLELAEQAELREKAGFRAALACLMLGDGGGAAQAAATGCLSPETAQESSVLLRRLAAFARAQERGLRAAPAVRAQAEALLAELEAELDGSEDVDVARTLRQLARCAADCPLLLHTQPRLEAFLFALFPTHAEEVRGVLEACREGTAVLWPLRTFSRLLDLGCAPGNGRADPVPAAALQLLGWAAVRDGWVASQVAGLPLGAGPQSDSIQQRLLQTLASDVWVGSASEAGLHAAIHLLAGLLDAGWSGVPAGGPGPLQTLLVLFDGLAEASAVSEASAASAEGTRVDPAEEALSEAEHAALRQLRRRRAEVYNPALVRLRHATLSTLCTGTQKAALLRAEPGVLQGLLKLVKKLQQASPQRLVAIRTPAGVRYEKRRFNADYADNPAGDYLLHMQLPGVQELDTRGGPTLLEQAVSTLCNAAHAGCGRNGALWAESVALAEQLLEYVDSPSLVGLATALADLVCAGSRAGRAAALDGSCPALWSVLLRSGCSEQELMEAARKLGEAVDTAEDGTALACLTGGNGALWAAWQRAEAGTAGGSSSPRGSEQGSQQRGQRAVGALLVLGKKCLDAEQRQRGLGSGEWPLGEGWQAAPASFRAALGQLRQRQATSGQPAVKAELSGLGRGFLGGAQKQKKEKENGGPEGEGGGISRQEQSRADPKQQGPLPSSAGHGPIKMDAAPLHAYRNGAVTLQEVEEDDGGPQQTAAIRSGPTSSPTPVSEPDTPSPRSIQRVGVAGEADVNDSEHDLLRDVFDSSHPDAAVRQRRSAWLALPAEGRLQWSQTSTDVSCLLAVPAGTRKTEISVDFQPQHIHAQLKWFGRLLDAELWAGIKPGEATWCLEDRELHLLLPKATPGWWKSLTKGGAERSYHELLHEAVHADEPVTAYDDLDDEAKDLIDAIRERQAYIAAGMLDPEGFDDFRVVIGENSLAG